VDQEAALRETAQARSLPGLLAGLQALGEARYRLACNANPRLTLEVLLLSLDA